MTLRNMEPQVGNNTFTFIVCDNKMVKESLPRHGYVGSEICILLFSWEVILCRKTGMLGIVWRY